MHNIRSKLFDSNMFRDSSRKWNDHKICDKRQSVLNQFAKIETNPIEIASKTSSANSVLSLNSKYYLRITGIQHTAHSIFSDDNFRPHSDHGQYQFVISRLWWAAPQRFYLCIYYKHEWSSFEARFEGCILSLRTCILLKQCCFLPFRASLILLSRTHCQTSNTFIHTLTHIYETALTDSQKRRSWDISRIASHRNNYGKHASLSISVCQFRFQ